jgi:hypothetical protein
MHSVIEQVEELLARSDVGRGLACESALRIGAATVRRAAAADVTAATVVCDVAVEDIDVLEALVGNIADQYDLEACILSNSGSFSVRFTRAG